MVRWDGVVQYLYGSPRRWSGRITNPTYKTTALNSLAERIAMDIFIFVLTTLGLGILCSIPGVFVGWLLATRGMVREKPSWIIGTSVCGLFVYRLWFSQVPLGYLLAVVTILLPLGMYRQDLWTYFRKGRFSNDIK